MEILAALLVLYLTADTASRGWLHATTTGAVTGAAKQTARDTKAAAGRRRAEHRDYLASGKAPLGRARLAVGATVKGATASVKTGARQGARQQQAARRIALDAVRNGTAGSPPVAAPPTPPVAPPIPAPAPATGATASMRPSTAATPPTVEQVEAILARPGHATTAAPAATTRAATAATTPGGTMTAQVTVGSVQGYINAWAQLATLAQQVIEQGQALGLTGESLCGAQNVVDTALGVHRAAGARLRPLVEGAAATPQGAERVTVQVARPE